MNVLDVLQLNSLKCFRRWTLFWRWWWHCKWKRTFAVMRGLKFKSPFQFDWRHCPSIMSRIDMKSIWWHWRRTDRQADRETERVGAREWNLGNEIGKPLKYGASSVSLGRNRNHIMGRFCGGTKDNRLEVDWFDSRWVPVSRSCQSELFHGYCGREFHRGNESSLCFVVKWGEIIG